MLHRDIWGHWFLTIQSGPFVYPDISKLRNPWADPIALENIIVRLMRAPPAYFGTSFVVQYPGHFLPMIALFTMLFDDDGYNEPGTLAFNWSGAESFSYTRQSL